jgi:hypothetical protein
LRDATLGALHGNAQHIPTGWVFDLCPAVGIGNFSGVARVLEVIE